MKDATGKALVLLSGGQDSTTCLYWAREKFREVHALSFDYGQSHDTELGCAARIAEMAGVASHEVVTVPRLAGNSPLTNPERELEKYDNFDQMEKTIGDRVELTFVPGRNLIFLALAANRAAALGIHDLVTGVCEADNANYPDCRNRFVTAMRHSIAEALGDPDFIIHVPLIKMTKADTVRLAQKLPGCYEALAYTMTAYDGRYPPKGNDHASVLRAHGFAQAGVPDPLVVRAWKEKLMELPATRNYDKFRK